MNLYAIEFLHAGPKSRQTGMKCLLLAENDAKVFEWLSTDPKLSGDYDRIFTCWSKEDMCLPTDKDWEEFREKTIKLKGDMNDEEYDFSDAYYGITLYGWKLILEDCHSLMYPELKDKIVFTYK